MSLFVTKILLEFCKGLIYSLLQDTVLDNIMCKSIKVNQANAFIIVNTFFKN